MSVDALGNFELSPIFGVLSIFFQCHSANGNLSPAEYLEVASRVLAVRQQWGKQE